MRAKAYTLRSEFGRVVVSDMIVHVSAERLEAFSGLESWPVFDEELRDGWDAVGLRKDKLVPRDWGRGWWSNKQTLKKPKRGAVLKKYGDSSSLSSAWISNASSTVMVAIDSRVGNLRVTLSRRRYRRIRTTTR